MSYSDFKNVEQVIQLYPLRIHRERFLPDSPVELPEFFLDNLNFVLDHQSENESEAFFRENFIAPFLQYAWKHHECLKLWVHKDLNYDKTLFGEPDYFISVWLDTIVDKLVNTPLLAVAEAKRQDFEGGWGQCLAEMIACQKLNNNERIVIYGIVSTGLIWEFGKLEQTTFTRDPRSFSITEPQQVAGILNAIFAACEQQIQ